VAKRTKFKLVIKTGNAAMLSSADVGLALVELGNALVEGGEQPLASFEHNYEAPIIDYNGQPVGHWKVTS
jgi:hypothetical protein